MTTRRRFVKLISLGAAALVALPARLVRARKLAFKLDTVAKLQKVDGSAIVKLKGQKVLFVRDSETTVKALSPLCTHQRCEVRYNPSTKKIDCACHGSSFDLQGKVLARPATEPLETYPASLEDGKVIVDLGG